MGGWRQEGSKGAGERMGREAGGRGQGAGCRRREGRKAKLTLLTHNHE